MAQDKKEKEMNPRKWKQSAMSMDDIRPMNRSTASISKKLPRINSQPAATSQPSTVSHSSQDNNNAYIQSDNNSKKSLNNSPSVNSTKKWAVGTPTTDGEWNISSPVTANQENNNLSPNVNQQAENKNTPNYTTEKSTDVSPASSSRPRTRNLTLDSVGMIKIAPAGKFEDLKSEAMTSWTEGVDLKLDSNSKSRKKAEWLTEEWHEQPQQQQQKPQQQKPQQQQTPLTTNKWNEFPKMISNTSRVKTYANAADIKTPDWALDDVSVATPQLETPYGYHQQPWAPTQHNMQHHVAPVVMMPSPYISVQPPAMYPATSPHDAEFLTCFYKVLRDRHIQTTLNAFQKKAEKILHRLLPELSPRTFAVFLQTLVVVMDSEASLNQLETARHIRESWHMFIFYFTRHLQIYAFLPEDLLSSLAVSTSLQRYSVKVYKELPIADMLRVYEAVKDLCTPELNKECIKHLRLLKALPGELERSWRDLDERLPAVPTAEAIVTEVINRVNVLTDYEAKKEVVIKNRVHNPWPNVDLLYYSLVHFMMLRDELLKPVQNTIDELFSGKPSHTMEMLNDCAVFERATPRATTILVNSSEPGVVFQLGPPLDHDEIMESFEEGSFVILLPEATTRVNPSDRHTIMTKIAKGAMLGQAVRASSSKSHGVLNRVVSIHVNKDDMARLDWSAIYTIITCKINASSAMSVLHWLHKEYMGLKKDRFSPVLTPRILVANNTLSDMQLTAWDEEYNENTLAINQDAIPDYLVAAEIDISCIMSKGANHKARPGEGHWPCYSAQWQDIAPSKRPPLYSVSPSQVGAIKFAMCHRIAVISGAPGTGKTFIASKLAQLMSGALSVGQFHQPVLIITKSQSSLDTILNNIVPTIPDVVRFGCQPWDDALVGKQATRLAAPGASDSNYRQHQQLDRQLIRNQIMLNALFSARFQASHHDPALLSTAVAPQYVHYLQEGYIKKRSQQFKTPLAVWNAWAGSDQKTKNYHHAQEFQKSINHAQWAMESNYLKQCGRGLMPIVDTDSIQGRFNYVATNPVHISSIVDAANWPFETSAKTGHSLRSSLFNVWKRIPAEHVWHIPEEEKTMLIESLANVLVTYLDSEIHDILQDQIKTAKAYDENLAQKWTYICRFNRVIGMTSDFAAAHRDWVCTLWPRAVIIDEASEILESTLVSTILGPRTEHVVLLGNSDNLSKPHLSNPDMTGNPRNLDVSLFERWKGSNGEMVTLEEQHRMHSQVASVIDQFNSTKSEPSSLLITAPLASCAENMVDGHDPRFEKMYGITERAFYVNYQAEQAEQTSRKNVFYSDMLKTELTGAEVDEARYVAFFAVYLSQQPYPSTQITILTTCLLQKYLIRAILREEVPRRTCFKSNVSKISLDTIEQNNGRQDAFTIVSTATPSYAHSTWDNVSRALTRSKYGVFVIGKPDQDDVHPRWKNFAKYMEERQLYGQHLQLCCHVHGDTFAVGKWEDFDQMKNGGCSTPCHQLMSDGHACQEVCHFMSHDEIVCMEPCNRLRPTVCQHACTKKCFECSQNGSCPPCEEMLELPLRCGHAIVGICRALTYVESIECQEKVQLQLGCGHKIGTECCKAEKPQKLECDVRSEVVLGCGHTAMVKCGVDPVCTEICNQAYECGHPCTTMCGLEHSHNRSECTVSCSKQLICGHGCSNGCANPDQHTKRCTEKCNYVCNHGYQCSRECWRDCIRCVSVCTYRCDHFQCNKKCFEVCDRPPCNQPCKLRLKCSHKCSGLCGEPCPPCSICNGDLKCSISLRTLSEFGIDEKVYMLPECHCVFSVESLDMYFQNQAQNGEHTAIKLWNCPACQKLIYRAFRYNKYIKTEILLVNTIKMRLEKERQKLTHIEREQIINAMNDETRHGIHNMVGGRWFVCVNKHPYFIGDCGGAIEVSKCPECDAPIGGTQHKVIDSNRFYGEFDGSEAPAWPNQPGLSPR